MITAFREAFPDMEIAVRDVVADDERIAWVVDGHGTHTGPFMGVPPTGRRVALTGVDLALVTDGRIRTHWSGEDLAGVLMQIGALPARRPPEPGHGRGRPQRGVSPDRSG